MADVNTILATGYIRSLDKIIGVSFVKQGGTSSQLLAADGSVKTESTMAVGSAASVSTATMAASSTAYLLGTPSSTTGTKVTPQYDTQAYISTDSSGNATVVAYKFSGAFSGNATSATTANVATSIKLQNVAQTESYLLMATASTGACVNVYANTGVKYDPTNKVLIAPKFSGAFSGGAISGTSLTLSASLTFSSAQNITWSGGSYLQRIAITDDSNVGTAVFSFQQSTDGGTNYSTLFTILDNSTVSATTFSGNLSGNASSATVATSLASNSGSSTLPVYFSGGKPVATSTTLGVCITGKASTAGTADNSSKVAITATTGTTLYVAVATTTSATSTALYSDDGMVYNASTNNLRASEFSVTPSSTIRYNTTEKCLEFVVI